MASGHTTTGPGQGLNRYAYVHNNPTGYTDPSGRLPCADAASIGGLVRPCVLERTSPSGSVSLVVPTSNELANNALQGTVTTGQQGFDAFVNSTTLTRYDRRLLELMPLIERASARFGVDPLAVATIIRHEGGNYLAGPQRAMITRQLELTRLLGNVGPGQSNPTRARRVLSHAGLTGDDLSVSWFELTFASEATIEVVAATVARGRDRYLSDRPIESREREVLKSFLAYGEFEDRTPLDLAFDADLDFSLPIPGLTSAQQKRGAEHFPNAYVSARRVYDCYTGTGAC